MAGFLFSRHPAKWRGGSADSPDQPSQQFRHKTVPYISSSKVTSTSSMWPQLQRPGIWCPSIWAAGRCGSESLLIFKCDSWPLRQFSLSSCDWSAERRQARNGVWEGWVGVASVVGRGSPGGACPVGPVGPSAGSSVWHRARGRSLMQRPESTLVSSVSDRVNLLWSGFPCRVKWVIHVSAEDKKNFLKELLPLIAGVEFGNERGLVTTG